MMKKAILILSSILVLTIILSSNGVVQTFIRAVFGGDYPDEIQKIKSGIVRFDLSNKDPAKLGVGIRYSSDYTPKEIKDWKIDGEIEVKLYKNNKLVKSNLITSINKISHMNVSYELATFYNFVWSPNVIIKPRGNLEIDLKDKFKGLDLILYDAGVH